MPTTLPRYRAGKPTPAGAPTCDFFELISGYEHRSEKQPDDLTVKKGNNRREFIQLFPTVRKLTRNPENADFLSRSFFIFPTYWPFLIVSWHFDYLVFKIKRIMANFEIRPRFKRQTPLSQKTVTEKIEKALKAPDAPVVGYAADHHFFLKIPAEARHYWSPELHLELEENESGTLIRALFGPSPSVWFMYLFFYALLGFAAMVVMIMGFSQLNLGLPAGILWILPVLLGLFLFAFFTAKAGQKLGHDEMHLLYNFLEDALEKNWERIP